MSNQNRRISIVTVCYNAGSCIENTIRSVINQSYTDYEYIIVDGASKDNTLEVVNKYKDKIDFIISEPDKGIYDAMNKGVLRASGEWLIMMNAGDCFADANVLEKVFARHIPDNITFLYSDVYGLRKNGDRILRTLSWKDGKMIHQATIYRKSLHSRYGFYHVTKKIIVSDYLFFISIPEEQIMKLSDVVIAVYEGGGISSQGMWSRQQAICADVVFRRRTFWGMIRYYMWKKIKAIIPVEVKDNIKILLNKN